MEARRHPVCSRCQRPILSVEQLATWLEALVRAGSRLYCSPECTRGSEALELTGEVAAEADGGPGASA